MKKFNFPLSHSTITFPKHSALSVLLLILAIFFGLMLIFTDKETGQAKDHATQVLSKLNLLQTNISALQEAISKPLPQINLTAMTQQIQQVTQQLEGLRKENSQYFDKSLSKTEAALSLRLEKIQQTLYQLDKKHTSITYLKPIDLPFNVVSLDSIQQVAVASVAYNFKTIPLEMGDALAGWKIRRIDYGQQVIEFENAKKERVLLTENNIG